MTVNVSSKQEQINHLILRKKCVANSCEQHHSYQEGYCGAGSHGGGRGSVGKPGRAYVLGGSLRWRHNVQ